MMQSSLIPNHSGLIWITGYSGAGKTTVARITSEKLKAIGIPVVLLDGDDLRSILGERFGYSIDDRRTLAAIYSRLCKNISDCGVTVVIATVAMFESIRIENRIANEKYFEVYLKVPLSIRKLRDGKGLYNSLLNDTFDEKDPFCDFDEPNSPDLVLQNYDDLLPDKAASLIVDRYSSLTVTTSISTEENSKETYLNEPIG